MNVQLMGIVAGAVFGVSWTGLVAGYLFYTRSSRRARNQYVIRLGQLLVGALPIGSVLLLSKLWEQIGLVVRSSSYYMSLYAFALSSGCVMFFVVRAEILWRKSSAPEQTSGSIGETTKQPIVSPVKRRVFGVLTLVSLGLSIGFAARWPRPAALYLGAASWLCVFAILVLGATAKDRVYALQLQRFMFVAFACVEIAMVALYLKFRVTSPVFSSAALAAAMMLCIGTAVALLVMRRIMPRT